MMLCEDVLGSRLAVLREIIRNGFDDTPAQVQGFIVRVLERENRYSDDMPVYKDKTVEDCLEAVRFDGYPALARAGYSLAHRGHPHITAELADRFLHCIEQQRGRPVARHAELAGDALALLGIADGLREVLQVAELNAQRLEAAKIWVRELLEQRGGSDARLNRARLLASDLLEDQGRFGRYLAESDDARVAALDFCLWRSWPDVLRNVEHPDPARRRELFKALLTVPPPDEGELIHAAGWLCALDVLTNEIAMAAVPDANQVTRILAETQGSFRRWRWEEKATRQNTMAARWLIDKEADVQAFLLAVLYPYFVDQLEDEQYLQGFGLRQGRFDFAITSLGLIVEVKVVRMSSDVHALEAEIADDLALYFKEGNPFKTMIVYIYDDRDKPEPEKYPAIRDALKRRSNRIVNVVIVQRPSMIPNRNDRQSSG
jgi:hypothetical protein